MNALLRLRQSHEGYSEDKARLLFTFISHTSPKAEEEVMSAALLPEVLPWTCGIAPRRRGDAAGAYLLVLPAYLLALPTYLLALSAYLLTLSEYLLVLLGYCGAP
eukprot:CAMPEP_0115733750 /NCGR_PEP_ID=MMETSP0272-20121206/85825_1 /TAXON_ID=71861 /ORGANISM="Scrippsiella trochoidea, Strain CCMP3099" /LENGTH=104 /DNA_ID=CAMNT_0003177755 /DNA_START=250 /DNA_END=564 /DNA_ORIENTATION=-